MSAGAHTPELLTIRGYRREPGFAPGGERFGEVVRRHLPLVYGTALALIPEDAAAVERVCVAVFETVAFRWRKLSRRTVLATWLVRTVWYAAARERKRLGLKRKADTSRGMVAYGLVKEINALNGRQANAFLLAVLLEEPVATVAAALRSKPRRVEKRIGKATRKLTGRLRKIARRAAKIFPEQGPEIGISAVAKHEDERPSSPLPSPPSVGGEGDGTALKAITVVVPPEIEASILAKIGEWKPKARKPELVRATISAWRRRAVGVFVRRLAAATGVLVLLAAGGVGSFLFLWQQGYLYLPFMHWYQFKMVRRFPEMAQPARLWPSVAAAASRTTNGAPGTAAELYRLTNVWQAKIRMTPQQWRAVQPRYVRPVPDLWDSGKIKLRNPNASRNGVAGSLGIDLPWSEGILEFAGQTFERVGVRFRGNGSYLEALQLNKKPYKVDLNRVKKGQHFAGTTTLNFLNELTDFSYLKDPLAQQLFRDLGVVAPRTAYAYLSIDAPGKFRDQPLGLYVLVEDINSDFAKDRFGFKSVPIFKPVTYELFEDLGNDWSAYKEIYDLKTKATAEQLARVMDFAKLVTHANDREFVEKLPDYLDLEEYAAFLAGLVLLSSYDGFLSDGQNFYLYLDPRSNKFGFIPWDQDLAWGAFAYLGTAEKRETVSIWNPATYDNRFLKRVMKVKAFRAIYRQKLEEALAGPFAVERLNREIDRVAAVIRPAIAAESKFRLERFETAISTNWVKGPRDGNRKDDTVFGPGAPPHQMKRFIQARVKSVRDQLDGKSEGASIAGFRD